MVDALVSGASVERRAGSSPVLGTEYEFCIIMEEWRNWSTRYFEGVVTVGSCEFESHLLHD